jgi:hypothetical protein
MGARKSAFEWGKVRGALDVPKHLLTHAREAGQAAYAEAVAEEFCGDEVAWLPDAPWHAECEPLFPEEMVRQLGFEPSAKGTFKLYSTHGTDPHTDDEGPCFILVLANDGLKFRQGKQSHVTNVGEWYIFDDRLPHTVTESRKSKSYVFLHRPLKAVS